MIAGHCVRLPVYRVVTIIVRQATNPIAASRMNGGDAAGQHARTHRQRD
jgi:hypothetical protein